MKKHFLSMLLLFVFVLGLGSPAAAYEGDPNGAHWDLETIGKYIDVAPEVKTAPASDSELFNATRATSVRPDVYIKEITATPVIGIYNNGTPESVKAITKASRTIRFSTRGQSMRMPITSSQFKSIESTVASAFASDLANRGKTYEIIAWYVESVVVCTADRPKYLEITPSSTCVNGTETERIDLPYTSTEVTIPKLFSIPSGSYDKLYSMGISGAFYFTYTSGSNSGTVGGAMMGASVTVNSDKTR